MSRRFPRSVSDDALNARLSHRLVARLAMRIPEQRAQGFFGSALTVAIITDTFMFHYYQPAFDRLVSVDHDNFEQAFERHRFDLLLYVTCWSGHGTGYWSYRDPARLRREIGRIVALARARQIPALFQSIEDPVHYRDFIGIAQLFDAVFTTDVDCIDAYVRDCGHRRVFHGEYGINPVLHNPIGPDFEPFDTCFFAGAYYRIHPERARMMDLFFDTLRAAGVDHLIADRYSDAETEWSRYPERFRSRIIDCLEHRILQRAHKLFAKNVNFNIVTDSPTMCAMRVYELQGLGCEIVSNHSLAIARKFPAIRMYRNAGELLEILGEAPAPPRSMLGSIARMFDEHTVFQRVHQMLGACGIRYPLRARAPSLVIDAAPPDDRLVRGQGGFVLLSRAPDGVDAVVERALHSVFRFSDAAVALAVDAPESLRIRQVSLSAPALAGSRLALIDAARVGQGELDAIVRAFFKAQGTVADRTAVSIELPPG